jgi:excisionase family DNA binding protein
MDTSTTSEILTLKEVAIMLKVGDRTVYALAQQAQLPGFKVGGQWRFKRHDLEEWIEQQKSHTQDEQHGKEKSRSI